jgi:hypothetical protein
LFLSKLDNVIEWAIELASQQHPNYPQASSSRRNRRCRQRFSPRNSPIASIEAPVVPSPVPPVIPNLDIPWINPVSQREPVFASIQPTVQGRNPSRSIAPETCATVQPTTSSEEATFIATEGPYYCYYPELICVSDHLPTRSPRELHTFKEHCRLQFQQLQNIIVLHQPLECAREITPSPLNFQNLLWRSTVTVSHYSIYEEYHWIRRHQHPHVLDKAILQPAYKVFYGWNTDGWSVSRLPQNQVNEQGN